MIQDLNDLSVLGKDNSEALEKINFDLTLLDKADELADEMSNLLGATTTERAESGEAIKIRNKAFTHLKEVVDEIRNFGQYVFWRNETRGKGYASNHLRRINRKNVEKQEEAAVPAI